MAGAIVDVLIGRLVTLTLDEIDKGLKLVVGVKREIQNLKLKLEAIRAVLEDAEQRQVMEASVKLWLSELNDVSFEMDDVLDKWITRVLMHQLEKQTGNAVVTAIKKVCHPSSSRLVLRHEISKKIKELNERLASIDQRKLSFGFQSFIRAVPQLSQSRKTTSLPNVKTFGRDNEKELLISKLLSESSEEKEVPLIIPIVGMGGLGKTYLANLVYNDEAIKSRFQKRIWVCVSDPFNPINIGRAIIEELDRDNTSKNSNELQTLVQCIYELLEGKMFLLVLDDVWNPTCSQWEELIKPLQTGAQGSRVLVTTRNENIATFMRAKTQTILLKGLSEASCLSLFYYNADMDESSVSIEFKDIGLELVKRCNGLPLATKTLGSLMRHKKNIHEWQTVLKSRTWELKEIQQDVFRPLLLSYHDLTPAVKRCLLYCAIFPKDYVYNRNQLIELWMSQDYLHAKGSTEMMIVGQNNFDDLVLRSFFQDIHEDRNTYGYVECKCKIHDIVHDFLQYLTESEIKHLEFDASQRKEEPNDKVHHLTLLHAPDQSYLDSLLGYKRLRTMAVMTEETIDSGLPMAMAEESIHSTDSSQLMAMTEESIHSGQLMFELIVELRSLRTLILYGMKVESIPKRIGELIHLRYLDLSGNMELRVLYNVLGSLYNLQTLRLVNCFFLVMIDVQRLVNLRHLHVENCFNLRLILGIEKLRDLQTLDWFNLEAAGGNKLEDLKDLNQLQGSLQIFFDKPMAENATSILVNKTHLQHLRQFFSHRDDEVVDGEIRDRRFLQLLEPPPALESLSIEFYDGGAFSDWLVSLHSLRFLSLSHCPECKTLPPLGKLASLESLKIFCFDSLSKIGLEFLGIEEGQTSSTSSCSIVKSFPKLKQLSINSMDSWGEWEGVEEKNSENITVMPCLTELEVVKCKELKALPDFLWKTPLQKLRIHDCPILKELYQQGTVKQGAKISHIPNIEIGEW